MQAGIHERVLTVAFEKQSESNAMWALSIKIPFSQPLVAGAGGYFAPIVRGYIRKSGAPLDTGAKVVLKDRLNALKNPYAHLHQADITDGADPRVAAAVGPDPLRRDLPVVRRRGGDGHRQREGRRRQQPPGGLDPRHRGAVRADDGRRP